MKGGQRLAPSGVYKRTSKVSGVTRGTKQKCEFCTDGKMYLPAGLGIHKFHAHGIAGTGKTSVAYNKKQPKKSIRTKAHKRTPRKDSTLALLPQEIEAKIVAISANEGPQASQLEGVNFDQAIREHTAYIHGHIETFIQFYARGHGIPEQLITRGLAERLRAATGR